ncbi:MAG: hypothetical protein HUJ22_04655 [Gracilimonas sp.]|uniref:hypothetical protein n=1 Tax=Gracilimonas sp. TaxID=1974203 RepID=UPI00199C237F|nr:hypothetical protein [Gracilimonas sp.]MBD3615843.1 hypothetical protein [Gracilimonas sp.]
MPRIKKVLPEGGLETIRTLGKRGVNETDIAKALGMSYDTWLRIKRENPEAKQAIQEARAVEEGKLVGVLYEKAMKGDATCAMFLLKTRHGYLEGKDVNSGNAVQVNITIPGSMDPEDYKKQIEVKQDE